jgi:hypothetical protein
MVCILNESLVTKKCFTNKGLHLQNLIHWKRMFKNNKILAFLFCEARKINFTLSTRVIYSKLHRKESNKWALLSSHFLRVMKSRVRWVAIALMMEAARTSETLVNFYQTTYTALQPRRQPSSFVLN